jgi:Lrp/AsnC family transcriptional regulator, leucine-responsive regulatory protein
MSKDIDGSILEQLKRNAKATTSSIAKRIGIPTTTVHNRIKRMERDGIIKTYVPVLDHAKLGKGICALIFISAEHKQDQEVLARKLLAKPDIESARIITGGFDIVAEARVATIDDLNNLIIRKLEGVDKTQTRIVLKELEKR